VFFGSPARGGAWFAMMRRRFLGIQTVISAETRFLRMVWGVLLGLMRLKCLSVHEGSEPPHIHVDAGDAECKFWLSPVALAKNRGMSPVDIRKVERLVYEHQMLLLEKYDDFQSPDGHLKLPHLWPVKFLQVVRQKCSSSAQSLAHPFW